MFDNSCEKSGVKLQKNIQNLFSFTEKVMIKQHFSFKKMLLAPQEILFEH